MFFFYKKSISLNHSLAPCFLNVNFNYIAIFFSKLKKKKALTIWSFFLEVKIFYSSIYCFTNWNFNCAVLCFQFKKRKFFAGCRFFFFLGVQYQTNKTENFAKSLQVFLSSEKKRRKYSLLATTRARSYKFLLRYWDEFKSLINKKAFCRIF